MQLPRFLGKAGMRIINMNAIFLLGIGTIVRFSYFKPSEEITATEVEDEFGETTNAFEIKVEKERFMFYFTTLIVLPALIALYVVVELNISESVSKKFNFLELYIGKAFFLLMLALMLLEKFKPVEIIFAIAILAIVIINFVVGFVRRNETPE